MKKAKIILTATVFLTVIGGAFAFEAMRTTRRAYTYLGATTWTSTNIAGKIYSTTVPVCEPLSIGGSSMYVTTQGIAVTNIYTTTFTNKIFTTTTAVGGPTVSTTIATTLCNANTPLPVTQVSTII